jgi:hypothetical protein
MGKTVGKEEPKIVIIWHCVDGSGAEKGMLAWVMGGIIGYVCDNEASLLCVHCSPMVNLQLYVHIKQQLLETGGTQRTCPLRS